MKLSIKKHPSYGESTVTIIGITQAFYGRPQYFLVNSDQGADDKLKFPGMRFRAQKSLEDAACERFREQTGFSISRSLGLRVIMPSRDRNNNQWLFRNVFVGLVDDIADKCKPDGNRQVYLAEAGQGINPNNERVCVPGDSKRNAKLEWVSPDNRILAKIATDIVHNLDWERGDTNWYKKIPCFGATPLTEADERPLGCGLSIASMMLLCQPTPYAPMQVILLKKKGDQYPGYAGGKIEVLETEKSDNIDPISACAKEGAEEYGFAIQPRALICCATTPLDVPGGNSQGHYNSLVTYSFVAEPVNPMTVEEALRKPAEHLEDKMECYVVESLDKHRDRVLSGELRMPDMQLTGERFYRSTPGEKIPLTQIRSCGVK